MNHSATVFCLWISLIPATFSLKPPVTFSQGLIKSYALPNKKFHCAPVLKGGAMFNQKNEEDDDFDQFDTLNEFARLQRDIYSPPHPKNSFLKQNQRKIGVALMTTGIVLTVLGMMLFFEGNLLRIGNLSFLLGTSVLVGPHRITNFFVQPKRLRATLSLALGIFLVLIKWSKLGIVCEIFGFFNLFGNMFPLLFRLLKSIPVVGDALALFQGGGSFDSYATVTS